MHSSSPLTIPSLSTPPLTTTRFVPKGPLSSGSSADLTHLQPVDLESLLESQNSRTWLDLLRQSAFHQGAQNADMLPANWTASPNPGETLYGKPIWNRACELTPNNPQAQVTTADELAKRVLEDIESNLNQYITLREPLTDTDRNRLDHCCASLMTALTLSLLTALISAFVAKQIFQISLKDLDAFAIQMIVETVILTAIFYGCVCRTVSAPTMQYPIEMRFKEHAYLWCKDSDIVQPDLETGSLSIHHENLFSAIQKTDPYTPLLAGEGM